MDREDLSFLESMFKKPVNEIDQAVLIINQSKRTKLSSNFENIRVINDGNYGLSRSRNLAMANSIHKYVWILDDDVVLLPDAVKNIIEAINRQPSAAALTFMIQLPDGKSFRNYPNNEFDYSASHLKTGPASIEIVLNVERLQTKSVKFNERFGLGAQFPVGEEQVLFMDLLAAGEQARFIPKYIVQHDEISSGMDPVENKTVYARGAIAAHENYWTAGWKHFKYVFFLWRKGYVRSFSGLIKAYWLFNHGAQDYITGFEGHRNHHHDL